MVPEKKTPSFFFLRAGCEPAGSLTTFSLPGSLWYTAEVVEEEIETVNKKEKKMAPGPDEQDSCQDILATGIHPPPQTTASCSALLV